MTKLHSGARRDWILSYAVDEANRHGLLSTTAPVVARLSLVSHSTVRYYFPNHPALWRAIVAHAEASEAVKREAARIGI